jgi:hypothetical protein
VPEAIPKDKTGANKPRTTEATNISWSEPAYTIAMAERPDIKVKHILQKPKDKNDIPQAITGFVATGNIDSAKKTGPTRPVISIMTSTMYKNEVAKEEMICSKPEISASLFKVNTGKELLPFSTNGIVGVEGLGEAEGLVAGVEIGAGVVVGVVEGDGLGDVFSPAFLSPALAVFRLFV